jgi:hypothetical protein
MAYLTDETVPTGEIPALPDDLVVQLHHRVAHPQPRRNWDFQTLSESPLGYFEAEE